MKLSKAIAAALAAVLGLGVSTAPGALIAYDMGDYYMYFGQRRTAYTVAGEVAVGIAEGPERQQVIDSLTGPGGLLQGYAREIGLGQEGVVLRISPYNLDTATPQATDAALASLQNYPGLNWSVPVFVNSIREDQPGLGQNWPPNITYGSRGVAADGILIRLEDPTTIDSFLGDEILGYEWGGPLFLLDTIYAGRDNLALCHRLETMPGVVRAGPDWYVEISYDGSSQAVMLVPYIPEPASLGILLLGAPLLMRRRRNA